MQTIAVHALATSMFFGAFSVFSGSVPEVNDVQTSMRAGNEIPSVVVTAHHACKIFPWLCK